LENSSGGSSLFSGFDLRKEEEDSWQAERNGGGNGGGIRCCLGLEEGSALKLDFLIKFAIDGQDPEEQGDLVPLGIAQGQAGQAEEGAPYSIQWRWWRR